MNNVTARAEASNAAARKPKVPLEFAPCLRSRPLQKVNF